jgi:hypothetical protein
MSRVWFSSLVAGAGRGSRVWRAPRYFGVGSPPNKPMHPTADTRDFMLRERCVAAGDWRR